MSTPYPGVLYPRLGGPVLYPALLGRGYTDDVITWAFVTSFLMVCVSFLVPYVSYWRPQKKIEAIKYLGIFISMYIWVVIMICNFGKEWLRGSVVTNTTYKANSAGRILAEVGVHIGFRGVNVTLVGLPVNQLNETINYNEQWSWEWQQGVEGHGPPPYSSRIAREYEDATARGVPFPILWAAEYWVLEGEEIHWGRFARVSGWYCHILEWIALVSWFLMNVLFLMRARYGATMLTATGVIMLLVNIVYSGMYHQNFNPIVIPYENGNITLSYGWCFYLNLFTGLGCVAGGIAIILLEKFPLAQPFFFVEKTTLVTSSLAKPPRPDNDSEPEEMKEEMIDIKEGEEEESSDEEEMNKRSSDETDDKGDGKMAPKKEKRRVTISAEEH
jgi:hypothetical protein